MDVFTDMGFDAARVKEGMDKFSGISDESQRQERIFEFLFDYDNLKQQESNDAVLDTRPFNVPRSPPPKPVDFDEWGFDKVSAAPGIRAPNASPRQTAARKDSDNISNSAVIDLTGDDDDQPPPLVEFVSQDAELKKALQLSLQQFQSGNGTSASTDVPNKNSEEDDLKKALEASMMMDVRSDSVISLKSKDVNPSLRYRQDMSKPITLRSTTMTSIFLPPVLLALFNSIVFRKAIIDFELNPAHLPATFRDSYYNYDQYWQGYEDELVPTLDEDPLKQDHQLIGEIQKLFVAMQYTRRAWLSSDAVWNVLKARFADRKILAEQTTSAMDTGYYALKHIYGAWENVLQAKINNAVQSAEPGTDPAVIAQQYKGLERALIAKNCLLDAGADTPTQVRTMSLCEITARPPLLNDIHACIANEWEFSEDRSRGYVLEPSRNLAFPVIKKPFEIPPSNSIGANFPMDPLDRKPFGFPAEMYIDRYLWDKREETAGFLQEENKHKQSYADAEQLRARLISHKDMNTKTTFTEVIKFLEQETQPEKKASYKTMRDKLSDLLTRIDNEVSTLDETMRQCKEQLDRLYENPAMKTAGPYRLASVLMYTGQAGRESAFAYLRSGEQWLKSSESKMQEVSYEQVTNDRTGIWMDAGSWHLLYELPAQHDFEPLNPPPLLLNALYKDNDGFAKELPAEVTKDWPTEHIATDTDVEMATEENTGATTVTELGGMEDEIEESQ